MKATTKTIISMLLATTVIGAGSAAADSRKPTWQDYRSTVTQMPISQSYNDIEINKTDIDKTTSTQTDNSKQVDDSFNRSLDVDVDLDESSRTTDSYNTAKTDNSTDNADSFNTAIDVDLDIDKSSRIDDSYNTDNSKYARESFNTDNSRHAADSFNRDESVNDSYNTWNNQRQADITDQMDVSQLTKTLKKVTVGDYQNGQNEGYQSGHMMSGSQGGLDIGGIGNEGPSYGGGYGYGGGPDMRSFRNDQAIAVQGPNLGAVSNTNVVNQGRDLVFGHNRAAVGNDFGNKQIFSAGDQAQLLKNDAYKVGDNDAAAVDNVTNSATKSSATSTQ